MSGNQQTLSTTLRQEQQLSARQLQSLELLNLPLLELEERLMQAMAANPLLEAESADDLPEPEPPAPAEAEDEANFDAEAAEADEGVPADIAAYCQALAADYGLTPREAEILALMALGRSAKYISEELTVSYNTTRTHVRHIYEKLNIHSKQELIDLVLFGSGVM